MQLRIANRGAYWDVPIMAAVFLGLYLLSLYSYLLFHSLVEIFSIVIGCGLFLVAWNVREFIRNNYLLFIGVAYLFVAGVDLVHMLSYKGMGVFTDFDANLPTQLWIAARYMESVSLLIAPMFIERKPNVHMLFGVYSVAFTLLLVSIFYWGIFPVCYVEGIGLTTFKIVSEYVICLILFGALALLIVHRKEFEPRVVGLVMVSIFFTIGSELAFTLYISVFGPANLIGHYFKVISFFLMYRAIIETGLREPYGLLFRELESEKAALRESEEALRKAHDELEFRVQERTAELKQTLTDLIRSNADLEHFAYVASHDLQEPLRTVAGAVQMLEEKNKDKLDAESEQLIRYAVDYVHRMKVLITDLLTYSRLTTRGRPFEMVNVQEVLDQSLRNLNSLVIEQGAKITCDRMPTIRADATQLLQVFQNLIGNAVKFGRNNSPKVRISARKDSNEWTFSVEDNGIGIEDKYFDRIFVIFQQLNKKAPFHGTGIGLAIVRKIVERHRGRVWVESKVGAGSTFYFTIPEG